MNICRMLIKWRIQASVAVAIILLLMPLSKVIGLSAGPNLRDQNLALFDPHMSSFTCELEAKSLPPIDAQAEAWFLQARELESPQIYFGNLDYRQIVRLTRQAAERHHWKALLNLASLYLEGHDVEKGPADALALVEAGMRLHLPAAYDRIGTYYDNGTGVDFDPSRAYAFWQKAALMGSPAAMGFLGKKLDAVTDSGNGTYWANPPIAKKMMSCAVGQGDGNAAFYLSMAYDIQSARAATKEEKQLALSAVQQGIRLGCEQCANKLAIQFSDPFSVEHMIVPFIDEDRAKRYSIIGDASGFDADYRFPNLDKVVPLPPADLPPWNGDRDTLLYAAMGAPPPHSSKSHRP